MQNLCRSNPNYLEWYLLRMCRKTYRTSHKPTDYVSQQYSCYRGFFFLLNAFKCYYSGNPCKTDTIRCKKFLFIFMKMSALQRLYFIRFHFILHHRVRPRTTVRFIELSRGNFRKFEPQNNLYTDIIFTNTQKFFLLT